MVEILPLNTVTLVSICIMIGAILLAYYKKIMMTYALLIANFVIFILSIVYPLEIIGSTQYLFLYPGLGFRPIYLSLEFFPQIYTLFTSMFVHGGFAHIFGNMLVFFFMGIAFEQRIGWKNFLIIYLITGVCGALSHSLLNLGSPVTLIGASGAIFGILGAFAYSYPRDEIVMPIPVGIMFITRTKVIYAALIFAVLETIIVFLEVEDNTAHFAHLGGLVSGIILAAILVGQQGKKSDQASATVYYDPSQIPKKKRINFSNLKKLATTPELKEMLRKIESESVLQVRDIWLDHFLEKTTCPKCNKPLNHFNGKIWCEDDHFKTTY